MSPRRKTKTAPKPKAPRKPKTPAKSINDLRTILVEEIENLRSGNTTAANVNAITNATGKVLASVRLEMDYAKLVGRTPRIPLIGPGQAPA